MSWFSNFAGNSGLKQGNGHTMFTDPNPLTGYISGKLGFNSSDPIGSLNKGLGISVPTEPGKVDLSQISGTDQANQQNLLQQLAQYQQLQQGTFAGQNRLAGSLQNTIDNPNAPSVARTQLGEGLDAITRNQLAASAGSSGVNAANARLAAAGNSAAADAQQNQQQALIRAQEVANAQGNLSNVYNSQLSGETGFANVLGGTAVGEGKTAETAGGENQTLLEKENEANANQNSKTAGTIGNAVFKYFSA
jgi:hypothetical protein